VHVASMARHTATGKHMIELHKQVSIPTSGSHSHSTGNAPVQQNTSHSLFISRVSSSSARDHVQRYRYWTNTSGIGPIPIPSTGIGLSLVTMCKEVLLYGCGWTAKSSDTC